MTSLRFLYPFFSLKHFFSIARYRPKFKTLEIFFACSLHSITFSASTSMGFSSDTPKISLHVLCTQTRFTTLLQESQVQKFSIFLCLFFALNHLFSVEGHESKFSDARDFFTPSFHEDTFSVS